MRLLAAFLVGVVEAQDEAAAMLSHPQPIVERGADVADMEPAGRRGGETGDDLHGAALSARARIGNALAFARPPRKRGQRCFPGTSAAMKLMTGNSNLPLARAIAQYMEIPITEASVRRFADEEIFVEILENVRGEDVFVLQSTSYPANDNLMELLICIDALKRASAKRITAVLPYFGYARQDRKPGPRTPISAKLVANLITVAGANRVLSVDLHAGQIQGFFDIPTDNLYGAPVMSADIQARFSGRNITVVSPDVGGVVRARALAKRLNNAPLAIVDKRREKPGESEVMNIIGDVSGRFCILIDDIVDSAGTLCNAAAALKESGAEDVVAYCTHGVLSGGAAARVDNSVLSELVITDSIAAYEAADATPKIRLLTIAPLVAEAIRRIADESSVSSLFD
jgi:ribose-phosphate pyrophosphokinase